MSIALNRIVQHATGNIARQRAISIYPPTYSFVGASTIDHAATLFIGGAPIAGANATINTPLALWVQGGKSYFQGNVILGETAASTLGFFGSGGAAKPTGVAVTAAGIHAALVALGLISA